MATTAKRAPSFEWAFMNVMESHILPDAYIKYLNYFSDEDESSIIKQNGVLLQILEELSKVSDSVSANVDRFFNPYIIFFWGQMV